MKRATACTQTDACDGQGDCRPPSTRTASTMAHWCERTTFHGVLDLHKSSSLCGRIVWSFLLAGFYVFAMYMVSEVVWTFVSHPHFETVSLYDRHSRTSLNDATGIPFPNIVVCNKNRINAKKLNAMNLTSIAGSIYYALALGANAHTPNLFNFGWGEIPKNGAKAAQEVSSYYENWDSKYPVIKELGLGDFSDLIKELTHTCEETFPFKDSCKQHSMYASEGGGGGQFDCCANVTYIEAGVRGVCMLIRPPYTTIHNAGPSERVELRLMSPRLDLYELSHPLYNTDKAGFDVSLQYKRHQIEGSEMMSIQPGYSAKAIMNRRIKRTVTHVFPYGLPCSTGQQLKVLEITSYDYQSCLNDCVYQGFYAQYGCVPSVGRKAKYRRSTCNTTTYINTTLSWNSSTIWSLKRCRGLCSSVCAARASITSRVTMCRAISNMKIPSIVQAVNAHMSRRDNSTRPVGRAELAQMVELHAYFATMTTTISETRPKLTPLNLVSQIGGRLSLFTGASLLTLVQLVYFMTKAFGKLWLKLRESDTVK